MTERDKHTQSKARLTLAAVVITIGIIGLITREMSWWGIVSCVGLGSVVLLKKEV